MAISGGRYGYRASVPGVPWKSHNGKPSSLRASQDGYEDIIYRVDVPR